MYLIADKTRLLYAQDLINFCAPVLAEPKVESNKKLLSKVILWAGKTELVMLEVKDRKRGEKWIVRFREEMSEDFLAYLPSSAFNSVSRTNANKKVVHISLLNKLGGLILETLALNLFSKKYKSNAEISSVMVHHDDVLSMLKKNEANLKKTAPELDVASRLALIREKFELGDEEINNVLDTMLDELRQPLNPTKPSEDESFSESPESDEIEDAVGTNGANSRDESLTDFEKSLGDDKLDFDKDRLSVAMLEAGNRLSANCVRIPISRHEDLLLRRNPSSIKKFAFDYHLYAKESHPAPILPLKLLELCGYNLAPIEKAWSSATDNSLSAVSPSFDPDNLFLAPGVYLIIGVAERGKTTLQRQIAQFCVDNSISFEAVGIGEVGEDFHTIAPATTIEEGVDILTIILNLPEGRRKKVFIIDSVAFLLDDRESRALSGGVNAGIFNFLAAMQVWAESQGLIIIFALNPGAEDRALTERYITLGVGRSSGVFEPNRGQSLGVALRKLVRFDSSGNIAGSKRITRVTLHSSRIAAFNEDAESAY